MWSGFWGVVRFVIFSDLRPFDVLIIHNYLTACLAEQIQFIPITGLAVKWYNYHPLVLNTTTFDKLSSEQHLLTPDSGCKQNNKLIGIIYFFTVDEIIFGNCADERIKTIYNMTIKKKIFSVGKNIIKYNNKFKN